MNEDEIQKHHQEHGYASLCHCGLNFKDYMTLQRHIGAMEEQQRLLASGQFINVKEWKEKLEAKRQQLISLIKSDSELEQTMRKIGREPYEIGYADAMRKARISELHLVERFLVEIPKSQSEKEVKSE